MPLDLNSVSLGNSARLRAEADAICLSDPAGIRSAFRNRASGTSACTAVDLEKLTTFQTLDQILPARGVIKATNPTANADEIEDLFRGTQVDEDGRYWGADRAAFEDHWTDGRSFVYFVLVANGLGLAATPGGRYGPYCLVCRDPERLSTVVAVFGGNSAAKYSHGGVLNVPLCEAEATTWFDRDALLTIMCGSTDPTYLRDHGDDAICSPPDRFCEVVRVGPFPLAMVDEVRVERVFWRRAREASIKVLTEGEAGVIAGDIALADGYRIVSAWQRTYSMAIVDL